MGVYCEINVCSPSNPPYEAGSDIFGIIKYAVDEETVFNEIDVSLNGNGTLIVIESVRSGDRQTENVFRYNENHVKLNSAIIEDETVTPIGMYDVPFHFKLPSNIPASLKHNTSIGSYTIDCVINYNIAVVFKRNGFLMFDKKVTKDIEVASSILPNLSTDSITYGNQKKILQLFTKKSGLVKIKADIQTPVVIPGEKLKLSYIVYNDTNITVKCVHVKVVELYKFSDKVSSKLVDYNDVKDAESKTGTIKAGNTQCMDIEISLPPEKNTITFSNLVSRDYFVYITIMLPFPHTNLVLKIPIQIGNEIIDNENEAPPTYREVVESDTKHPDLYNILENNRFNC